MELATFDFLAGELSLALSGSLQLGNNHRLVAGPPGGVAYLRCSRRTAIERRSARLCFGFRDSQVLLGPVRTPWRSFTLMVA